MVDTQEEDGGGGRAATHDKQRALRDGGREDRKTQGGGNGSGGGSGGTAPHTTARAPLFGSGGRGGGEISVAILDVRTGGEVARLPGRGDCGLVAGYGCPRAGTTTGTRERGSSEEVEGGGGVMSFAWFGYLDEFAVVVSEGSCGAGEGGTTKKAGHEGNVQ